MNRSRLFSVACFILLLLLFVSGCGLFAKPEKVIIEELDALKKSDRQMIAKYLAPDSELTDEAASTFALLIKDFDYKIIDTKKSFKKATVTIEISTLDMKSVVQAYQKQILTYISVNGISDLSKLNTTQLFDLLRETLNGNYETVTQEIKIPLKQTKNNWIIQTDELFSNALTGNFSNYLNDPDILTAKDAADIYLSSLHAMDVMVLKNYLFPEPFFSDDGSSEEILCNKIKTNYQYEIISVTEDGNTATAAVRITNIDLSACIPKYKELIIAYAKSQGGLMPSQEAIEQAAAASFTTAFEQNEEIKVMETTITLTHNGTIWLMKKDDAFLDVLMGGFTDFEIQLNMMQ